MGKKHFLIFLSLVILILSTVLVTNCKKDSDDENYLKELVGNWKGTWNDTVYNVSGKLTVTFAKDGNTITATGTIDLSIFAIGTMQGTGTGTIEDNSVKFTFKGGIFGEGSGTVTGTSASGSGTIYIYR